MPTFYKQLRYAFKGNMLYHDYGRPNRTPVFYYLRTGSERRLTRRRPRDPKIIQKTTLGFVGPNICTIQFMLRNSE